MDPAARTGSPWLVTVVSVVRSHQLETGATVPPVVSWTLQGTLARISHPLIRAATVREWWVWTCSYRAFVILSAECHHPDVL